MPLRQIFVVSYGEIKRVLKRMFIYECRCNEKLQSNFETEGSTHLVYTGLHGGLEHLKIESRLRGERVESVKGERFEL